MEVSTSSEAKLISMYIFLHFAEQLYEEIFRCTTEDKGYYSAHFVSLQKEFVKDQPPNVKNLIRLVKYWRKTCIEDKSSGTARLPSSYPLELITIGCWEKAGKPSSFDIRAGFKAVLGRLINSCQIHFIWDKNYNKAIADRGIEEMESKRLVFFFCTWKIARKTKAGRGFPYQSVGVITVPSRGSKL